MRLPTRHTLASLAGLRATQALGLLRHLATRRAAAPLLVTLLCGIVLAPVSGSTPNGGPAPESLATPLASDAPPAIAPLPTPASVAVATAIPLAVIPATATPVPTATPRRPVVAIDPGHGGPDDDLPRYDRAGRLMPWYREGENSGVIYVAEDGSELREKDLTLRLALAAAELLESRGVAVVLTRREDVVVNRQERDYNRDGEVDLVDELLARVEVVNDSEAELLVSLHFNAHPSAKLRGTYTQFSGDRPFTKESIRLGRTVHDRIVKGLRALDPDAVDRNVEEDIQYDPTGRHLVLLGPKTGRSPLETRVPGVLIELLFLTHEEDVELLRRQDVLDALPRAIADGILDYLGR